MQHREALHGDVGQHEVKKQPAKPDQGIGRRVFKFGKGPMVTGKQGRFLAMARSADAALSRFKLALMT
ncbi:MAG TPA: hypothetical protein DEF45_06110 [Rhodopirellula sp.]|nr:MAG: hypothetical protein CBD74_04230 [Saprospirales bacterium TMED214]HBV62580.1 hypothetical protein [Rhodopirellula sp.]